VKGEKDITELKKICLEIRKDIIRMLEEGKK